MKKSSSILLTVLAIVGLTIFGSTAYSADPPNNFEQPTMDNSKIVTRALKKCGVCHGKQLHGKKKAPAIAGLREAVILKALEKPPRPMLPIARGPTAEQKKAVAAAVTKLPKAVPAPSAPSK